MSQTDILPRTLADAAFPKKPGERRSWHQLQGCAEGHAVAQAAVRHNGLSLVLCSDGQAALRMEQQLEFFLAGNRDLTVLHFPDWETLPYDTFSPHQDIVSDRLSALSQLPRIRQAILVVPMTTVMHRLPPQQYVIANSLILDLGETLSVQQLRSNLENVGYQCVDTVYEHGEFAVRGSIVDLFPMGSSTPYRIELFDDEIESLRSFDAETQRTVEKVERIRLLPAREFPLDKAGINEFKDRWHEQFDVDHRDCAIYQDVANGIASPGLEYYLPLFFAKTATLFDYLPENTIVFTQQKCDLTAEGFWQEINHRYEQRSVDKRRPILRPMDVFLPLEQLYAAIKQHPRILLDDRIAEEKPGHINLDYQTPPRLPVNARAEDPWRALKNYCEQHPQRRLLFCAESPGRRESLLEQLNANGINPKEILGWQDFQNDACRYAICVWPLDEGMVCDTASDTASDAASDGANIALIAESQLYGERVLQRRRRKQSTESHEFVYRNLTELRIGAPVVHADHGIGRYLGLQTIEVEGQKNEFLTLEYADDSKLYVPVASLHLISRYTGADEDTAPLHKLGSDQWQRAKRKAAENIRDTAAELLDIYARRAAREGFSYNIEELSYRQFADAFPFEETPDQEAAIAAVLRDMRAPTPMDRLVCGDVGFGKTEVAMRAAFIAVHSGKQVALLVPTTLLAQQHYESFRDRFADWPVSIEVLSRFRSGKETDSVKERLEQGKVDIVIGTHKIIQGDIKYQNLGLVIIDEEHRFGVKQKETLKSLRAEVDILTLTATPIPRTLNMSMSGIRDLSIIATPPAKRLSVKTFVRPRDKSLIKEALLRELLRGGQIYYLHNEVNTIDKTAEELRAMLPEARIGVGHGQMRERQLEQVMSDFYHKRFNILVCTTIIETGIDVPSANTIIIDRADKFGLAQLHQLRGRVGRSHHQAYAYLLTPEGKSMTVDAEKRLAAISEAQDLGSGFMLATHDLEIRGAGELLGDEQSGQIHNIGFTLYMEMLENAVAAIKEGRTPNIDEPLAHGSEINLRIPALIPDSYLPDVHTRLITYKRIANAANDEELKELQVEMIDRFGLLPNEVKNLFRVTRLKLRAQQLGIEKIEASATSGKLEFAKDTKVEPIQIVQLVQSEPQQYQLAGANTLKFSRNMEDTEQRLQTVHNLLDSLAPNGKKAA